jgi:hypothetical protein
MKKISIFLFVAMFLFGGFEWMRADAMSGADLNQEADYYCKGRGYDQGFAQNGMAECATYTVRQGEFKLP